VCCFSGIVSAVAEDQGAMRGLFIKSREQSDLREKGRAGFILTGNVRVWIRKDELADGRYAYVWTPDGRWREEVTLPGYKRTRIGNETQFSQMRTQNDENPAVFEFDQLVRESLAPNNESEDGFRKATIRTSGKIEIQCYGRETGFKRFVNYCFDTKTNDLVEVSRGTGSAIPWKFVWQEYANFQEWSGKRFPRLMRGYNGKRVVVEVQFDEIKPAPKLAADVFAPENGATDWAYCSGDSMWKLKDGARVPVYPDQALMHNTRGTVVLYVVIGEDGRVSHLNVIKSSPFMYGDFKPAGLDLNQSALAAVSQWRYEHTPSCQAVHGPKETFIEVEY